MNSIDAKGYKFLQQNLPGNDGYGQIGLRGDAGRDGNSVYFTPYVLSTDEGMAECVRLLMEEKELSNNPRYESSHIEYKVNDIILDKLGDVYILKTRKGETAGSNLPFTIAYLNNIFSQGSITGSVLQCKLNLSADSSSDFYYRKKYNDSFIGRYNNSSGSPYIYHRDRYVSRICGAWLYFTIPVLEQNYGNYIFKYVLLLPNGQRLEKVTETTSCEMFIDNRYFYGCRFPDETMNELRNIAGYHSIEDNKEYEFPFTYALVSCYTDLCKAYVDITNKDTHRIYRIYADNIMTDGVALNQTEESES